MFVVATAGHVDHGKSTLVKALTGQEPDRWEEEKARGLTIDLGFVWTNLPSGRDVAFVDVPGHEKFLGNMLAGVGPAPAVLFIVAADEGWQEQSEDHLAAIDAFGVTHGVVALTRADKAEKERLDETRSQVSTRLNGTSLENAQVVDVSAVTGAGLDQLRTALDEMLAAMPAPDPERAVRLWIDRAFTIKGAGTVVTGTLAAGTISVGDTLHLGGDDVQVRSLQSEERSAEQLGPATRVAVNLRGVDADSVSRGDVLLTPGAWELIDAIDVRRLTGATFDKPPREVVVHVGTAAVQAALRRLDDDHARLTLERPLPLVIGDRLVLRKPGDRSVYAGVAVLDLHPPELGRRGASKRRAEQLGAMSLAGDPAHEVARRGAMTIDALRRLGLDLPEKPPRGVVAFRDWWVDARAGRRWGETLNQALDEHLAADTLSPGLTRGAALSALELPDEGLFGLAVAAAKLEQAAGVVRRPGSRVDLGGAEEAVAKVEQRLRADPFAAPEADELAEAGLGQRELATAERAGRLLRLRDGVVLLPTAPAEAKKLLLRLEQPFTTSAARRELGTTRRVAIPLLEHLDSLRITRRLDGSLRQVN